MADVLRRFDELCMFFVSIIALFITAIIGVFFINDLEIALFMVLAAGFFSLGALFADFYVAFTD